MRILALETQLEKAKQELADHAEDWAMCGIPHDSITAKALTLSHDNRTLRAERDQANDAHEQMEMMANQISLELAAMKRQRDALLEMTWLDLPSEPQESIAEWRKLFEAGWERKGDTPLRPSAGVVLSRLFAMSENADKVSEMTNAELAEELRRKLGDIVNMHELAYDLIEEAATRLENQPISNTPPVAGPFNTSKP